MLFAVQRRWFVAIVLVLTPTVLSAQDPDSASDKKKDDTPKKAAAATHEIKRESFRIEVKLSGTFEPVESAPISVRPKAWTSLQVFKAVPHGTAFFFAPVRKHLRTRSRRDSNKGIGIQSPGLTRNNSNSSTRLARSMRGQ